MRLAKSDPLMFGSSLADVFSAPAYDCRVLGQEQKPEFAVTRLRSGPREMERSISGGSCAHASIIAIGSAAANETGSRTDPSARTNGTMRGPKASANVSSDLTLA